MIVGDKFNEFTIIEIDIQKNKRRQVKVLCSCGKEEIRRKDHIINGRSRMCRSCASKETAKKHPPPKLEKKTIGKVGSILFNHYRFGAKKRGIEFKLVQQDLWDIFEKQNEKCALTGVPLVLSDELKNCNVNWDKVTASLDRIDSDLGYYVENIQWVHKDINRFKREYSSDKFLSMCKLVVNYANQQPNSRKDIEVLETVQRLGGEESTNNLPTSAQHPTRMMI